MRNIKNLELGNNGRLGKVNIIDPVILLIQVLILRKVDPFQERPET